MEIPIPFDRRREISPSLAHVAALLERDGSRAWLVGEALHRHLRGELVVPLVASDTPFGAILERFPRAVPTCPGRPLATCPSPHGPIDLLALAPGQRLIDALGHCDFGVRAMALSLHADGAGELADPWGGLADLEGRVLRCVGDPQVRVHREPGIALCAARLVARDGYHVDPALASALPRAASGLDQLPTAEVRRALWDLLGGEAPGTAIALLREAGLEAQLVPGAADDAAEVVDALPPDRWLRLAAWLRGTHFGDVLARWRFEPGGGDAVRRLLERHPVDESVRPTVDRSVLRFVHRVAPAERERLLTLRRAEITAARARGATTDAERGHAALAALEAAMARVGQLESRQRAIGALAIGGQDVMAALGCDPGRTVGRALAHLSQIVAADPSRNQRDELLAELAAWHEQMPD